MTQGGAHFPSLLSCDERQECHDPCTLDRLRQDTLVFGAHTAASTRNDLRIRRHVPSEPVRILVVDRIDALHAEAAMTLVIQLIPLVVPSCCHTFRKGYLPP